MPKPKLTDEEKAIRKAERAAKKKVEKMDVDEAKKKLEEKAREIEKKIKSKSVKEVKEEVKEKETKEKVKEVELEVEGKVPTQLENFVRYRCNQMKRKWVTQMYVKE